MSKKINTESIRYVNVNETFNMTIPERNKNSICWFETAAFDYKTASTLLDNKIYCHSFFFMQQCVECIVKGLLIENKIVNAGDIKKWSHSPEEAFSAFYKFQKSLSEDFFTNIKVRIIKEHGLEAKLEITKNIINYYCHLYEEKKTTTPIEEHIVQHILVEAVIISLSILLNTMQQNTRYPNIETCKLPSMLYDESEIVVEYAPHILEWISYVLRHVYPDLHKSEHAHPLI